MDKFVVRITIEQLEDKLRELVPVPASPRGRKRTLLVSYNEREDSSEAIDEYEAPRKRKRVHNLSNENKDLVMSRLLELKAIGNDFKYSVRQVKEFFDANAPRIGENISIRTLHDWRRVAEQNPKPATIPKKRGTAPVLSPSHRAACGELLKRMGESGSPMNTNIARSVILGYMQSNNLMDLYSYTPSKQKISLSSTWILKLLDEYNLSDRAGTTDIQKLPDNWQLLVKEMNYRVAYLVAKYNIPPALVFNFDQFGLKILSLGNRTRVECGSKYVPIIDWW